MRNRSKSHLFVLAFFFALFGGASTGVTKQLSWQRYFSGAVPVVLKNFEGDIGIYVKRLSDGSAYRYHASRPFYYASAIKLFVLMEAYQREAKGRFKLSEKRTITKKDLRDGSGISGWIKPGKKLTYQYLVNQMIKNSDNLATDVLIGKLGVKKINRTVRSMQRKDLHPIISMLEVRRRLYGQLDSRAKKFSNLDYLYIRKRLNLQSRLRKFERKLGFAAHTFTTSDWRNAAGRYYRTRINSGSVEAYGRILEKIVKGKELGRKVSNRILSLLRKVKTGKNRLRKGLPRSIKLAHKTGTQYRRMCDMGVAGRGSRHEVVIAVCAKDFRSRKKTEKIFARLAKELYRSKVFSK